MHPTAAGPGLIDTAAEITAGWLGAALAPSVGPVEVADVDVVPVGTGQMGDSVRVAARYASGTGPDSVVVKLPAADATSRTTALVLRSYEKEVRFYQQVEPTLRVTTPRAFHADIDPATARFVLVLEDLAPARVGDQLAGCPVEEAVAALDELVGLHAPRWDDPTLREHDWLVNDGDARRAFTLGILPGLWQGFTDRYAAVLDPDVLTAGGAVFGGLEGYLDGSDGPDTVIHGDYRLDNLLFDAASSRVRGVVDWQTCTLGSALDDVAYFVGAGLLPDARRAHEDDLVRRYHEHVTAAGVDLTWDDCWRRYRRGTWAGLIMAVGASMLVERTERGDAMFMAMASRHSRHALDLDAPALLG